MLKCFHRLVFLVAVTASAAADDFVIAAPVLSVHFDEQGKGRSAELIRTAFAACGDTVTFRMNEWGQHWQVYEKDDGIDGVAITRKDLALPGTLSDPFVFSTNGVLFVRNKVPVPATLDDLANFRVVTFSGAARMFPELQKVVESASSYRQATSGYPPHRVLKLDRADYFFTDGLMAANDYLNAIEAAGGTYDSEDWPRLGFAGLVPGHGEEIVFRKKTLADRFNGCLLKARESGDMAKAEAIWLEPFADILDPGSE